MMNENPNVMGSSTAGSPNNGTAATMPQNEAWKQAFGPTPNAGAMNGTPYSVTYQKKRRETKELKKMKENFSFFGPVTLLYAVFYAFCMYNNDAGITFLFFMIATIAYMVTALKKLDMNLKKGSIFYFAAVLLLAVSTFCTDDWRIIFFNKSGIFLLMMSLLLKQFYKTEQWELGKYLGSILYMIFGSLEDLPQPFEDTADYVRNEGKDKKNLWYALLGVLIAVPFLIIVVGLLASADVFFGQLTDNVASAINVETIAGVAARIVAAFLGTYILVSFLCRRTLSEEVKDRRNGEPVLAITVTTLLTLVYLLFSGIQIFGLFLGKLQLPQGYTYAQYAREGFFQLLAVSILNLIIVLFCMSFFKESKPLKAVLTVMSLCTFIMIASSAMRMILYIQTYDLTFLRILVLWTLGMLTCMFIGVLARIFKENFPLFRYGMVVVTILYLGLSFSHPDYIIASVNVQKEYVDYAYLNTLCADAAPVLIPYVRQGGDLTEVDEEGRRTRTFHSGSFMNNIHMKEENLGIRTFNVSRYIAASESKGL